MKLKKKSKLLAAAIALLGLSTAASVTGTVAWFTAATNVKATGMSIQAEAEEGILITNESAPYTAASWGTAVEATYTGPTAGGKGFVPTTTLDGATWKHANASNQDNYASATAPVVIDVTVDSGIGSAEIGSATKNVYLLNHFYVQSSTSSALSGQDLFVKTITASDTSSLALNKSLRVLFVCGSNKICYAPLAESNFAGTTYSLAANKAAASTDVLFTGAIPAYSATSVTGALDVAVYIYFDGEDSNCKSSNITTFNTIDISFELENRDH